MPERLAVTSVAFPSGISLTFSTTKDDKGNLIPVDANLCIECHQGRESTLTMNNALAAFTDLDKADPAVKFRNVHYLAAARLCSVPRPRACTSIPARPMMAGTCMWMPTIPAPTATMPTL